ncbi:MAG: hypothetical protein WCL32_00130 [Planctomycetota bacterium]
MKARRVWFCLGGGMCLTAAMLVQRVWGQGPPPGLPGLPIPPVAPMLPSPVATPAPITVPSKQIDPTIPIAPPITQSIQPPPSFAPPSFDTPSPEKLPATNLIPSVSIPVSPPMTPPTTMGEPRPIEVPAPIPASIDNSTSSYRAPDLGMSDTRPGKQEPAVSVEWLGAANARYNIPTNYQIVVRNNGSVNLNQVTVKPNIPEGAVIKASEPVLSQVDNSWNVGTLTPGQVRKIDVTIQSQKRGYQNYSATVFFAANSTHLTEVREPLLQIKMKAPDKALVGEPAPIVFTISNPGDGATENVKIRAVLPEGLEHPRGQAFEIDAGTLAPKETRTLQLACMAKGQGQMKATLIAMADGNLTSTDTVSFELLLPRLDIVLNGPKLRFVERPARYTMKVSNPGTAAAQGVVLNEIVPAGFKFSGASNQGKYDELSRTVSWQLGDLQAGQGRELYVDLVPMVPGDHRLAAAVHSARGIRNESSVQTRVEGLSNLILEVSNADNPVEVGADATYEIRVANAGTKAETNVEVICTMPDSVEFRDAKNAVGSRGRNENREVIFDPLPRLAPRGEVIYRVTVKGRLPGDVRFRVRLRAEGMTDAIIREETTKFYDDTAVR